MTAPYGALHHSVR